MTCKRDADKSKISIFRDFGDENECGKNLSWGQAAAISNIYSSGCRMGINVVLQGSFVFAVLLKLVSPQAIQRSRLNVTKYVVKAELLIDLFRFNSVLRRTGG